MGYKNEINKKVEEQLKNERKNNNLVETYHILEAATELLDAIEVDITNLHKHLEKIVKTSGTKNPLNAILQMFGLRIVKDNLVPESETSSVNGKELMTINDEIFHIKYDLLIEKLGQYEKDKRKREFVLDEHNSERVRLIESLKKELQQERLNHQSKMEGILLNIQQLLTEVDEKTNSNIYDELVELLKDIGIEINWEIPEGKLSSYYTVQKISKVRESLTARPYKNQDGDFLIVKPCFIDENGVRIKGLIYMLFKEGLPREE